MIATSPFAHRTLVSLAALVVFSSAAYADKDESVDKEVAKEEAKVEADREKLSDELQAVSAKLEGQIETDDVKAAEQLYQLEQRAIELVQRAESDDLPEAASSVRASLQRILRYEERVREHAQEELDRVLPGEPERKLITTKYGKTDRYAPLYRQGTPQPGVKFLSEKERLAQMRADFVAKGGNLDRDIKLLGGRYLDNLESGVLAEWAQIDKNHVAITTAGAKHPVIAGGRTVPGAGGLKVYRDAEGEIALVLVSTASGNFKPGVSAGEGLVQKLVSMGVREDRILTTSVMPGEPEIVKLLLKSKNMSKEQINARMTKLASNVKTGGRGRAGRR